MKTTKNRFFVAVTPDAEGAALSRKEAAIFLGENPLYEQYKSGVELTIAEWVTNLGKHPYRKSNVVNVCLSFIGGTCLLEFEDYGSPFEEFPDWIMSDNSPELMEHGMGLSFIANYFPYRSYMTMEGKNRLRLQCYNVKKPIKPMVLLVDDDPVVRIVYGEYLAANYKLLFADSAEEAMCLLEQSDIDLVMSDINMPNGASGLDLCARIREKPNLETIPLIFLTGKSDRETQQIARDLAIDDYLIKPVKKEILLDSVQRVINNTRFVRNRLSDKFDAQLTKLLHPSLPETLGSFSSSVRWWAAEAGGGDILFHRRLETGSLIVLADLMGHGAQAKFFSHALSGYLSGVLSAVVDPSPKVILDRLNSAFFDDPILRQTLTTAVVVQLQDDGRCFFSNAGHPPPLMITDDDISTVDIGGPLLGLNIDSQYQMTELQLSPGQRIFLYTDGLAEIGLNSAAHKANFERVLVTLGQYRKSNLQSLVANLARQIEGSLMNPSTDDITVSFLEYQG